ncbi:MAG: DUF5698 domain-containing protein [Chloroflexota bacterium]
MASFFLSALFIFLLRLVDISLYTVRIFMVVRGRKGLAMLFAFCQAFVFVNAIRAVLSDLGDWGKIFGYCTGFATGLILGMLIEARLAIGFTHLRIISSQRGAELAEHLRQAGFAATEVPARGRDGAVSLLICITLRKDTKQVVHLVEELDPEAFITAESVRPVQRGFWHR